MMADDDFADLLGAVRDMVAVERGETPAGRVWRYDGSTLVEVVEDGRVTWRLADASAPHLARAAGLQAPLGTPPPPPDLPAR